MPTMRLRYEFSFHTVDPERAARAETDPTLALMGAQGWEVRGIAPVAGGALIVVLQRPYDDEPRLPDAPALTAALAEPLAAPSVEELQGEAGG
jgi:hypothetical protein